MCLLFRLDDGSIYTRGNRDVGYIIPERGLPYINSNEIDQYIAEEIRKQVNGCKNRNLLSYSKSLGVCLLKYNRIGDDELHICNIPFEYWINTVVLDGLVGDYKLQPKMYSYDIYSKFSARCYIPDNKVRVVNFCIDVSDEEALNRYLLKYTVTHKKVIAKTEKDAEVIMMQPYNVEFVIHDYIDEVYILYGLNQYYGFLKERTIVDTIAEEISNVPTDCFMNDNKEQFALVQIIYYLHFCGKRDYEISKGVYNTYLKNRKGCISVFSDPKMLYDYIMHLNFCKEYEEKISEEDILDILDTFCRSKVSKIILDNFKKYLSRFYK